MSARGTIDLYEIARPKILDPGRVEKAPFPRPSDNFVNK